MVSESWMLWLKQNWLSICAPLAWLQAQLLPGLSYFFLLKGQGKDEEGKSNLQSSSLTESEKIEVPQSWSSQPRDWTQVSCITDRFFTIWATRELNSLRYYFSRFSCVNTNKLFNPFEFQFFYKIEMIITRLANVVKLNERIRVKGLLLAQCLKIGGVLNSYPFHHHTPHHYPHQLVCRIINSRIAIWHSLCFCTVFHTPSF